MIVMIIPTHSPNRDSTLSDLHLVVDLDIFIRSGALGAGGGYSEVPETAAAKERRYTI
jgi:hypothetical protein